MNRGRTLRQKNEHRFEGRLHIPHIPKSHTKKSASQFLLKKTKIYKIMAFCNKNYNFVGWLDFSMHFSFNKTT